MNGVATLKDTNMTDTLVTPDNLDASIESAFKRNVELLGMAENLAKNLIVDSHEAAVDAVDIAGMFLDAGDNLKESIEAALRPLKDQIDRLNALAKPMLAQSENGIKLLKDSLEGHFDGILAMEPGAAPKVRSGTATAYIQRGVEVEVLDLEVVPDRYLKKTLKLAEVKKAHKGGLVLPGVKTKDTYTTIVRRVK